LDPGGPPRLAEVLTRKPGRAEFCFRKRDQLPHVADEGDPREVLEEDSLRALVDFAQEDGLVASGMKSYLDATDTGEQAGHRQEPTISSVI
jgi:hypothetical protein